MFLNSYFGWIDNKHTFILSWDKYDVFTIVIYAKKKQKNKQQRPNRIYICLYVSTQIVVEKS